MMGRIRIKRAIERVPGGMMLVPLLLGACVATFAPHAGAFFGSVTNALFTADLAAVLGGTLLIGVCFVGLNVVSDQFGYWLDPRVR